MIYDSVQYCYNMLLSTVDFIYYGLGWNNHLDIATLNLSPLNLKHDLEQNSCGYVTLRPSSGVATVLNKSL